MDKENIIYLLNGWVNQTLTQPELGELTTLLADDANREALMAAGAEIFDSAGEAPAFQERLLPYLEKAMMADPQKILKIGSEKALKVDSEEALKIELGRALKIDPEEVLTGDPEKELIVDLGEEENEQTPYRGGARLLRPLKSFHFKYAAAAVVLLCFGAYLYFRETPLQKTPQPLEIPLSKSDILPGAEKAILTLSNGKQIELNTGSLNTIVDEGLIIHNDGSALSYTESKVVVYNTMRTPNGGQYKLELADGTKVWLNAASSITYPTSFPGDTRDVRITGEAYFEVVRDPARPFKVKTYREEVVVTGTAFNVNSYQDEEDVKISLLNGVVHVNALALKPGESYINGKIGPANLSQDLAWKNGVFNFHKVRLPEAMRQIARWYDVDIRYQGNVGNVELGGEIGRNLTLNQLLTGLQDADLQFDLQGRVLTVRGQ